MVGCFPECASSEWPNHPIDSEAQPPLDPADECLRVVVVDARGSAQLALDDSNIPA